MATAITPEQVETHTAPVAENPQRVEVRKVAIDNSTLSVLAVGVALFALAFGAFTHLSGRIESLDSKLSGEIKSLDSKLSGEIKSLDAKLSGRMDGLDAKIERVATDLRTEIKDVNGKLDKLSVDLDAKIEKVSAEQRAENREINARLDRLFELVASQGRERP